MLVGLSVQLRHITYPNVLNNIAHLLAVLGRALRQPTGLGLHYLGWHCRRYHGVFIGAGFCKYVMTTADKESLNKTKQE